MQESEVLTQSITKRYDQEAESCCNLSCGGALDLAKVVHGEVVLDLGSGRGNDVLKAADLVGDQGMAIGVDFTPRMIQVAEMNRKKLQIANVRFIQGEIDRIPLEDSCVDVVISNCTVNHAKDKAAVYREVFRVLKAGGRFVISDILAETDLPEGVKNDPDAWAACYGGAVVKEEYEDAIYGGGFASYEILEESEPYWKGGVKVISATMRGIKQS